MKQKIYAQKKKNWNEISEMIKQEFLMASMSSQN